MSRQVIPQSLPPKNRKWCKRVAGQPSLSLKYHPQPQTTENMWTSNTQKKELPNSIVPNRRFLKRGKKSVPERQFCTNTVCSSYVQPWLVAIGGWRLATGGWWRLVVVGGGWWLVNGGWWRLAVVGHWRLVAARGWRLVAAGGWWLVVPWGGSLRAVLNKKKCSQRTPLVPNGAETTPTAALTRKLLSQGEGGYEQSNQALQI